MIDLNLLVKPDYPLFEDKNYESPIKGLVVEKDPELQGWDWVYVTVYLEDDTWLRDKIAKMLLVEVMDVADKRGWILMSSGFMKKVMDLEEGETL